MQVDDQEHNGHEHSRVMDQEGDSIIVPPPPPPPLVPMYTLKYTLKGHAKPVSVVKLSPDGRWIATGSADQSVKLWSAIDGRYERTLLGHAHGVNDVAWHPDSAHLASASDDSRVRLWAATGTGAGTCLRSLAGHTAAVFCLAFHPRATLLATGSFDETVRFWDPATGVCVRILPAHSDPVTSLHFSADGSLLVSGAYDGLVRLWDTRSGLCLRTLVHPEVPPVGCVRFTPNGRFVLVATLDGTLRLWSIKAGGAIEMELRGHDNAQFCIFAGLAAVPLLDGGDARKTRYLHLVACGSENGGVYLWNVEEEMPAAVLRSHKEPVIALDYAADGSMIVSGGNDTYVKIWVPLQQQPVPPRHEDEPMQVDS
ncbi:will die slowly-like protein [Blastocladiella britannica]|nr:will die slowly-like protein [Blastocladiella britannica]